MTIYETIDSILATVKINDVTVPFFYGMQEFSETFPEPDNYIVYDLYGVPIYTGAGKVGKIRYHITFSVFTKYFDYSFIKTVRDKLISSSFLYSQDLQTGEDDTFPYYKRTTMEFIKDMEA